MALPQLESEGNYEHVEHRLANIIERDTEKVESPKRLTIKQSEELREKSLEEWNDRMIAGLNDQTKPFPQVW